MPTVAKPDEIADALNAPTLDGKTTPIKKMAESKVSLDTDAVSVRSLPYPIRTPLTAGRPYPVCESLREGLPCPMRCRAVELALRMTPSLVLLIG